MGDEILGRWLGAGMLLLLAMALMVYILWISESGILYISTAGVRSGCFLLILDGDARSLFGPRMEKRFGRMRKVD